MERKFQTAYQKQRQQEARSAAIATWASGAIALGIVFLLFYGAVVLYLVQTPGGAR